MCPDVARAPGPTLTRSIGNGYAYAAASRRRRRRRRPFDCARAPLCGTQLRPASRRAGPRRRLLVVGRARAPLSRHDERVLGGELRPRASAHRRDADRAGATARGHVARVPQSDPAAPVRAHRAPDRARSRDSVERRRRGGRDGVEDRTQVGLPGQGHSRRQGRGHRLPQQLPRALDHDRRLFVGAAVSRRLRPVRARIPRDSVRRRECACTRNRRQYRGLPRRADTGRGRDHRAAAGLPRTVRAHLPRAQRSPHLRRNPDRPRPHRQVPRVRARGRETGRRDPRQGARRRPAARLRVRRDR